MSGLDRRPLQIRKPSSAPLRGLGTSLGPQPDQPRDYLLSLLVTLTAIVGTIVQWPASHVVYPRLALPVFVLTSLAAVSALFPWTRLAPGQQTVVMTAYMLLGALLLPLAHTTTTASFFPYMASVTAGLMLPSRRAAIGVALAGAVTAAGGLVLVSCLAHPAQRWSWWLGLTVGLPVYFGISRRDRADAVLGARQAAAQARRAADSEARAAALEERGRIAREIHDVLGHSLSGIAMQLEMADVLRENGRDEEAAEAIRRARSLAADSIGETRRAVHALREDTLPLPQALCQMAESNGAGFEVTGTPRPLRADSAHTLVRAAQESLTNAAKYAPGATCAVRLDFADDLTRLTVANGAAATAPSAVFAESTGMGLVGMRERVALLGGTLRAGPRDEGWTVELEIPR